MTTATPATTPLIKPVPPVAAAPAAAIAEAHFEPKVAITAIDPSPTNPRRRFDQTALEELAASIKQRGLVHPILLRNGPDIRKGNFEIVAGERRYRAAKLAGLTHVPATIQDLDDLAVAEIQLMENAHRQDLNALEEAIGYQNWIKQRNPGTDKPHTIDEIAAKVNKSRRHIHNRLALLKLAPEVQDAISAGTLDSSKALLLTLLGNHNSQRDAMKAFLETDDEGDLPGHRACAKYINDHFLLDLTKAVPFDVKVIDYKNNKGDVINRDCASCPRRSGNDRDLFGDIKGANVCTDIVCYRFKTAAHTQRRIDELAGQKATIVRGKEAEKMTNRWGNISSSDLMTKDDRFYDVPTNSKAYGQPVEKLLGKDLPVTYIENPTTFKLEEFVDRDKAKRLLSKAGLTKPTGNTSNNNPRSAEARAKEKAEQAKIDAGHKALFLAVRAKCKGALPRVAMEYIAKQLFYDCDNPIIGHTWSEVPLENDRAAELHAQEVMENLDKVPDAQLIAIVLDLALATDRVSPRVPDGYKRSLPVLAAKAYGLDPAKIVKDAAAELKPAAKPAREKPAAPAAKNPTAKNKTGTRPKSKGVDAKMQAQIDKEVLAQERKRAKKK